MICKKCKNSLPEGSVFCMYCGEKLIQTRAEKKKIKLPKPTQLPSGSWFARVTVDKQRVPVTAATEKEWYVKAAAIKEGLISEKKAANKITLRECCENYIKSRSATISPSTLRGYNRIVDEHFQNYMDLRIDEIDWQKMINDERKDNYSGKTIKNAWGLVSSSIHAEDITPSVTLPQVIKKPAKWFNEAQMKLFIEKVQDQPCEIGALLALHGLRRSEIYAVTKGDIRDGVIHVEGAYTESDDGFVMVETNKNSESRREVPIVIDRLQYLVDQLNIPGEYTLMTTHPRTLYKQINKVCEDNGLPKIGVHGCRKTYASALYKAGVGTRETMKLGGWSDTGTMERIYIQVGKDQITEAAQKLKILLNTKEEPEKKEEPTG